MSEKVSIILPVHNGEAYLHEAIDSVLTQTHLNWELITVDDGSSDETPTILGSYTDERIRVIRQENRGVSAARNRGLQEMKGDYLLFLDADDALFPKSLESRLERFSKDPELAFVDGKVHVTGPSLSELRRIWTPSFEGFPKDELLTLSDSCFVTITWLIRVDPSREYRFDEELTHCEDLDFYLSIADQGKYGYVEEAVMAFRRTGRSAMSDLRGLEKGYRHLVSKWTGDRRVEEDQVMRKKARSVIFRSYLKKGAILQAAKSRFGW